MSLGDFWRLVGGWVEAILVNWFRRFGGRVSACLECVLSRNFVVVVSFMKLMVR